MRTIPIENVSFGENYHIAVCDEIYTKIIDVNVFEIQASAYEDRWITRKINSKQLARTPISNFKTGIFRLRYYL